MDRISRWISVPNASENPDPAIEVSPGRWMLLSYADEKHIALAAWVKEDTDEWVILVSVPDPERVQKVRERRAQNEALMEVLREAQLQGERKGARRRHSFHPLTRLNREVMKANHHQADKQRPSENPKKKEKSGGEDSCMMVVPNSQVLF